MNSTDSHVFSEVAFFLLLGYVMRNYTGDSFFVSISGCSNALLAEAKKADTSEYEDIHILCISATRMDFDFDEIVRLRNDKSIKKIIVFSNASLQRIESLRDFTHVYQDNLPYEDLWPILEDIFFHNQNKEFPKKRIPRDYITGIHDFIRDIITEINPILDDLVSYLYKSVITYIKYENVPFCLNSNLYVLGVWSSLSTKFLKRSTIRRIAINSVPATIQKKLSTPKDITKLKKIEGKDLPPQYRERFYSTAKQNQLLKQMFYQREYAEAFKYIAFEQMDGILRYNTRKASSDKVAPSEDVFYVFENIYHMYLMMLSGTENIKVTEQQLADAECEITLQSDESSDNDDNDDIDPEQAIPYSYFANGVQEKKLASVNFKKAIDKINRFKDIFEKTEDKGKELLKRCEELNISGKDRDVLQVSLKQYVDAHERYIDSLKTAKIEKLLGLHCLLEKSKTVRQSFLQLIKVLYALDESVIKQLASVGFLSLIVEIDFVLHDERLYIPIYSPIILFYMQIVQNRYLDLFPDCVNLNKNIIDDLEILNACVLNDCIRYSKELYQLSDTICFPYFLCFENIEQMDSIKHIEFKIVRNALIKFIRQFPYKHTLKLYVLGELDGKSLKSCLRGILRANQGKTNLSKIRITAASKTTKNIGDMISTLLEHDATFNIDCRTESVGDLDLQTINKIIRENDIVIFLDSRVLYRKPVFYECNLANVASRLKYRNYETEKSALPFEGRNMPVVPYAINALLNASEQDALQEGVWDCYRLDMTLFENINRALEEQGRADKNVVMVVSDHTVDNQILNNRHVISIDEEVAVGSEMNIKILVLGKKAEPMQTANPKFSDEYKGHKASFIIPFSEFCNALNCDVKTVFPESVPYFQVERELMISYEKFPQSIGFALDKLSEEEGEAWEVFCGQYLKRALVPKSHLDTFYKRMAAALFMRFAANLQDIVFVHYFSKIDCEGIENLVFSPNSGMGMFSSLQKNYLFRVLHFLDAEEFSEHRLKDFNKLIQDSGINENTLRNVLQVVNANSYIRKGYIKINLTQYLDK